MDTERMRCILETLARSFTNCDALSVIWGRNPCTDFEKIVVSNRNEIVPGVECTPAELWLNLKASCAHEAGHLVFTDKAVWDEATDPLLRYILNIVEDARVERSMSNLFPGTLRWFRFSNEYIFLHRSDWKDMAPPDQALYGLISYAVVGRLPEGLPENEVKFVSECAPLVDEGRTSETTEGAARVSEEIAKVFLRYYGDSAPSSDVISSPESHGTFEPRKSPKGHRDPRRKPVLPIIKPKAEPDTKGDEKIPPKEDPRKTEYEAPRPVEDADDKPDAEPDNTGPGDAEDDSELNGDFSPGEDAPAENKPDIEPDGAEGGGGSSLKENHDLDLEDSIPGVEEDSKNDDPEAGEPHGKQEGEPGEASGDSSAQDDRGTMQNFDESEGAKKPGEDVIPDEGVPSGDNVEGDDEPEPDDTGEESPEEDLLTGMGDLLEESEAEIKLFAVPPEEKETVPEYSLQEIEEAARAGKIKSRLDVLVLPPNPKRSKRYERILKPLAHKAAEEVRKILEGRHTTVRRNLRKGALDPSALWKVPVGEPDLFMKRDLPGQKADLAVYLLIDCSGSMQEYAEGRWPECRCRMDYAAYAAILLHLMCRELNISHAATGFTTRYVPPCSENVLHLPIKKFSDRDGSFEGLFGREFRSIMFNNVDGYSIRAATKELSIRPEKQKVLFVISDGVPEAYRYTGAPAYKDTALAVREAERSGIGVIGIYIGESDPNVKLLYPNLIMLSAGDLPIVLARTLKKVITGLA